MAIAAETPAIPVVFLMGPTASGKSRLAVELVQRLPFSIVSVDSAMVYRGMDIGTAKPDAATQALAPHRLIDICDPADPYSAGRFREDACREIAALHRSGRIPLLVGGTGLYFRALQQGLSALPPADAGVRARLAEEGARLGWEQLHRRLARVDPAAARRIKPGDRQRIQRALEVHEVTGVPWSEQVSRGRGPAAPFRVCKIVIAPGDRERLRARIERRFQGMLDQGFMAEAEGLFRRGDLGPELPSMRLVGYRQAWCYLAGDLAFAEMVRQAVVATRRLAKRQLTWLRGEAGAVGFDSEDPRLGDKVLKYLQQTTDISRRV